MTATGRAAATIAIAALGLASFAAPALAKDSGPDPDDRVIFSGGTSVPTGETTGDVIVFEGDIAVDGTVNGDVVAFEGDVAVRGTIDGDLTTFAGRATLGPRARVTGDVIYSDDAPAIAPRAVVGGEIREEDWSEIGDAPWAIIGAAALWIAVSLSLLVAGVALVAIFPKAAEAAQSAARSQIALTIAMGLAVAIGLPLIAGLSFVSLVGIPLAIVLVLAHIPIAFIGYLVCCFVLGRAVTNESAHPILAFLAGLAILRAIALIPIAGSLAWIPAVIVGLGALVVAAMPKGKAAPAKAKTS